MPIIISEDACAAIAYDAVKAYNVYVEEEFSIIVSWEAASVKERQFFRNLVRAILSGVEPQQLHEQWRVDFFSRGWKVGPVEDPLKKENPHLVPYDQLPKGRQQVDNLIVAIVKAFEQPQPEPLPCLIPPPGWICTRARGHDGPCAAHPILDL